MKNDKIKEITEKLENGVKAVFESGKYEEYLSVMSRFHSYSFNNSLLILMQCPTATLVAGYKAWQTKFNRQVRKGEASIKILAPMIYKKKVDVETEDGTEEQEISYTRYRAVSVFDVSQTDGEDLPEIARTLTDGVEGYHGLIDRLIKLSPVPVLFEAVGGNANGYFHQEDKRIAIKEGMSEQQTVKTLVHEIAHSILHDKDEGTEKEADRRTKEVQAESIAYVVNNYIGIDTSDYSFGYVAGWSSGKDVKELQSSLKVIRDTAHQIIEGMGV